MNIPEPEFELGAKKVFLIRDTIFDGHSMETLRELAKTEPSLDVNNPCPVIKVFHCRINGRAYEVDDQEWIYHWYPSHGLFPSWEEQESMGWYPAKAYGNKEDYPKIKE